ncbi:MAG: response regulator [Candidatus Omnitrophota bacterium]
MSGKKQTILLVDDEVDFVETLAFQLRAVKGYHVVSAYNGVEGLEKLKQIKPDLIILDMNMPKMGGIAFYKSVCDSYGEARCPILVLTARANLAQWFKDINIDGFMSKPFEFEELFAEIDTILKKRLTLRKTDANSEAKLEKPAEIKKEAGKTEVVKKQVRALIVENDQQTLDKLTLAFLNEDYIVSSAKNGITAVEKIMSDVPDLLIIKLGLPDLSGDLVIAKLKQMPKTMDVACILYAPEGAKLDRTVVNRICRKAGVRELVESVEPYVVLKEAKIALEGSA